MSLVMNKKPQGTTSLGKQLKDDQPKQTRESRKNAGKAGGKNLQLAMDLNREMEEMFAESGIAMDPKPAKKTKKKQNKQV